MPKIGMDCCFVVINSKKIILEIQNEMQRELILSPLHLHYYLSMYVILKALSTKYT